MSSARGRRAKRLRLWSMDTRCYWCRRVTVLPKGAEGRIPGTPKNLATLDHMYNRLDPLRKEPYNGGFAVLACWECNQKRGKQFKAELKKQKQQAKAQGRRPHE
jgi:hypothetical protein